MAQLQPHYGSDPVVTLDGPVDDVVVPFLRQRRRFHDLLGGLTDDQWRTPSRCDEWDVHGVAGHLVDVDRFWESSIRAAVAGSPTTVLASFDPQSTPPMLVAAAGGRPPAETLDQLHSMTAALCALVEQLDDDDLAAVGEAPPGHVPVRLVLHHALWDCLVHERDVVVPLGLDAVECDDELVACLRYAAALGPCLAVNAGSTRTGALVVRSTDPTADVVVEVGERVHVHGGSAPDGALVLEGRGVELLEALSVRAPFPMPIADEHRWLVSGLLAAFDVPA